MISDFMILKGEIDGCYWLRPVGKGTFMCSPMIKDVVEGELDAGREQVVIDLAETRGMDSTFMGTLAGLAVRMQKGGRRLQLAGVDGKNRDSLEDLGLDALMDIEPANASWRGKMSDVRASLSILEGQQSGGGSTEHILTSHRNLSELSGENEKKFKTVIEILEQTK